jgi:hypothetical protein
MPDRPQPEYWGYPPFGDGELDAWLSGNTAAAPPAVDEALSALLAQPSRAELTGESRALAEFRRTHRSRGHQLPVMWLASAAALIVLVCGAAAVTGRLPTPIQNLAHVVFAGHPTHSPSTSPSTSSATHAAPSRQPDTLTSGEPTRSPDWAPTPNGTPAPDARNPPSTASPHNGMGGSGSRGGGFDTGGSGSGDSGSSGSSSDGSGGGGNSGGGR